MSIFVSVASYRDAELVKTLESLVANADNPQDLVVAVLSQDLKGKHPNLDFVPNLKYDQMHSQHAKGAGYARKRIMEQYNGEDYFFQIDSHMRFAKGWDTKLLHMLEQAQEDANTNKVILSQFPAPYDAHTDGSDYYPKDDPDFWDRVSWTSVVNTFYGAWAGHRNEIEDKSKPHPSHTVLAGYIFTIGDFVNDIPYDERITFMGEELCIAIRAYTRGYRIYAPNEMLIWHFYQRKDRPKVWSSNDDKSRQWRWRDLESQSHKVQQNVLLGLEEGDYGIGDRQQYLDYQAMVGIDFARFYEKELTEKINMGLLYEELDFNSTKKSGYCINDLHKNCLNKQCECTCHKEK